MAQEPIEEAKWTAASRKQYHKEHPDNFAGPDMSFPIRDRSDVGDAWNLAGHAANPDAVRAKIKAIAKRLGFSDALPDTAKDDDDKKESSEANESVMLGSPASSTRPKSRIATIQVCWIEDNARSLNGRIYPPATVDRLIASGQRKIMDENALPITCFLSHADADNDHVPALIGKATKIWREGSKGMALLDLADTSHAKDALGLIAGGYIRTESLRAKNAELRTDSRYDMPVVVGENIDLEGIDLTNYPGLEQVARIQQVQIAESAKASQPLTEVFDIATTAIAIQPHLMEKGLSMSEELNEAVPPGGNTVGGYTPTSGNTVGVTSDPTQDQYGQRMYQQPPMTTGPMQGMDSSANSIDLREAHDRIAMVQARECAPARESTRWKIAFASLEESERQLVEKGRSLSGKNDKHLDVAHDSIAKHMGMDCEGKNNKRTAIDPDGDGDDDRTNDPVKNPDWDKDQMESSQKGNSPMSKEQQLAEARKLLEAEGFTGITPPPTPEEQLRESLLADLRKELSAQLATQQQAATPAAPPQRRSMVESPAASNKAKPYQPGQYMRERINSMDWRELTDRTRPLPADLDIKHLIKEFEQLYALQYDDRFQILSATELR